MISFLDALPLPALFDWAWTFIQPEYELFRLVKKGDHASVAAYLLQHSTEQIQAAAAYTDSAGRSPLIASCREGHVECLHLMLQHPVLHAMFAMHADGNGNTLLHHACFQGHPEVVRYLLQQNVVASRLNHRFQSPLDVARAGYYDEEELAPSRFLTCVDMLEQRCTIFEGWVYESTDNIASNILGTSSLQSWKRRYCVVLETALRSHVEMVLYGYTGQKGHPTDWTRSRTPCSLVLARLDDAISFHSKQKIFNSKQFAFSLPCRKKCMENPVTDVHSVGTFASMEFAAVDALGYEAWSTFFVQRTSSTTQPLTIPVVARPPAAAAPYQPSAPSIESIHFEEIVQPAAASVTVSAPSARSTPSSAITEQPKSATQTDECVVCFDGPIEAVCVPCGHHAMCMDCASTVIDSGAECPVCRATLREVIKLYRA
ncbi:hypothetical protein H310_01852 [Aphanomyces invadans]|uniref:RING-type domain-containing protein n=1 Tax=Aphanomyces invadans TaxID=157072 RepID=A0A024UN69_9STRA|nr:hypothetical protein H310_01852 [Aphanomyces invadans]ETW07297.1 hypothetical protein H310_01852 [Aphanomyces invadans]|eukprot:XP_008863390.1 hypothetical protein H310_01852 [Aphanomyces invadans]